MNTPVRLLTTASVFLPLAAALIHAAACTVREKDGMIDIRSGKPPPHRRWDKLMDRLNEHPAQST